MLLLDAAGNSIKVVIKVLTRVTKKLLEQWVGTLLLHPRRRNPNQPHVLPLTLQT